MIKILNGIHETVDYDACQGLKLYHNKEAENYPIHWHNALEIIVPYENEYTVVVDGQAHTFHEGDIWITSPGTLHELIAPACGERMILLFDYRLVCNVQSMDSLLHLLHPYALITRQEYPDLNKELLVYLEEISREYDNQMPFTEACVYSLMIRFFVSLGRTSFNATAKFPGLSNNKQHEYIEKFMMVCNYITEHCAENLDVNQLADIAGFSRFHFARLFKQFTNVSCYEYLTQQRIAQAERLLTEPNISVTEVAMRSGFNSLSTFNRIFKASKHCTPSEYKNLNRTLQKSI